MEASRAFNFDVEPPAIPLSKKARSGEVFTFPNLREADQLEQDLRDKAFERDQAAHGELPLTPEKAAELVGELRDALLETNTSIRGDAEEVFDLLIDSLRIRQETELLYVRKSGATRAEFEAMHRRHLRDRAVWQIELKHPDGGRIILDRDTRATHRVDHIAMEYRSDDIALNSSAFELLTVPINGRSEALFVPVVNPDDPDVPPLVDRLTAVQPLAALFGQLRELELRMGESTLLSSYRTERD